MEALPYTCYAEKFQFLWSTYDDFFMSVIVPELMRISQVEVIKPISIYEFTMVDYKFI